MKVTLSRLLHITFGCVNSPPNSSPGFWSLLTDCLDDPTKQNVSDLIILGDLNVNALSPTPAPQFSRFSQFLPDMQLMNIINELTRLISYSCLDLILVPVNMAPGVHKDNTTVSFLDGARDHHQITSNIVLTSAYRNPQVHDMTIDDAVTFWQRSLITVVDTHCPEKLPPIPTQPPPLPWQTPALHQLFIKKKTDHRVLVKNSTCTTSRENFRALRIQSKIINSKARLEYYQHLTRFAPNHDFIGNYLISYSNGTISQWYIPFRQLSLLQHFPP